MPGRDQLRGLIVRLVVVALLFGSAACGASAVEAVHPDAVVVAGDRIVVPLTDRTGLAEAGRRIVLDRETGNCLICHRLPEPAERFQGDLGPDLAGVGRRLDPAQIRLRIVDQSRVNPATVMPPYYRVSGLARVALARVGQPVLTAGQIEDVIAYLVGLKE